MGRAPNSARTAKSEASCFEIESVATERKPRIVTHGTTGDARTFTGTCANENCDEMAMMTGIVKNVAERGIASKSATKVGAPKRDLSQSEILGERVMIPAVASTERRNPISCERKGSISSRAATALPSAAIPIRRSPFSPAIKTISAMTPALSTDGEGLTKRT